MSPLRSRSGSRPRRGSASPARGSGASARSPRRAARRRTRRPLEASRPRRSAFAPADDGHSRYLAGDDALRAEQPVGKLLQRGCRALGEDDLETMVVVEVHVRGGDDAVTELVLDLDELLRELADV